MIVKDYKLNYDAAGVASLWVLTSNGSEVYICNVDGVQGLSADKVHERVMFELSSRGIEVRDELDAKDGELIAEVVSIDSDLAGIRSCMRRALKNLNSSTSVHKKKDMIPVYDSMCRVSQVLINACKASVLDKK